MQVRINPVGTPWHEADVAALGELPVTIGARVPKAEQTDDVLRLAERLPGRDLHLLIESAIGVERAFEMASQQGVATLGLGEADLRADLSVTSDGLGWGAWPRRQRGPCRRSALAAHVGLHPRQGT